MDTTSRMTAEEALQALRQLPAHERLQVLSLALPETARELAGSESLGRPADDHEVADAGDRLRRLRALQDMCAHLNVDITEENIAEARREMWGNFPRDDIV